jgi:hypothetical protein
MDSFRHGDERYRSSAMMAHKVADEARRAFGDQAKAEDLNHWAREAVDELWTEATRVTLFIPALALRGVRDRIDGRHRVDARPAGRADRGQCSADDVLTGGPDEIVVRADQRHDKGMVPEPATHCDDSLILS